MRDRTSTKALENGALRYGVYAEDGSLLRYEYLALEDDPADPGTELSKATLLQDSTEVSLFGSSADRTVDEAFAGIAGQLKLIKSDMAAITLTVQDTNGKPIPEVLVQGILSENGTAVYTNASGVVTGYIGEGQQPIKITGYADIEDYAETLTVVKGTTITKTIKLPTRNFLGVNASGYVKFSGNVNTIDYSVTSGGGGGGGGHHDGGSGGAGGGTIVQENMSVEANKLYQAVIGSGGAAGLGAGADIGTNGQRGGVSSFMGTAPASGEGGARGELVYNGQPGPGGGKGGAGQYSSNGDNGSNATSKALTSFDGTTPLGGGGGGGTYSGKPGAGGEMGGGRGGAHIGTYGKAQKGSPNTGGGGGGGSGDRDSKDSGDPSGDNGAAGGSGYIGIRMHLKSEA